ncbi:MAG: flagellar type III secretion system protein FlhB [Pseudomonadota bacterium]
MDNQTDSSSKPFEASQHKLDQARRKGELARSSDLNSAFVYAGFLLAAVLVGASSIDTVSRLFVVIFDQASDISKILFEDPSGGSLSDFWLSIAINLLIWFTIPTLLLFLSVIIQKSFVFSPSKLMPKISRISIIQNTKNKYGISGLFEFGKSLLKLVLFSVLLIGYILTILPELAGTLNISAGIVSKLFVSILIEFLSLVFLISFIVGIADYSWHYFDHLRRQRMTYKEVRDETKEQEGDPVLKQERKLRGSRISGQHIATAVPQADVVVVNPEHYAVALKWSRETGTAPECVAKGVDETAQTIKKIAFENNVPIRFDPPTARALFASTEIGQEVDTKHYRAVATAIQFAEHARKKAAYWS